MEECAAKVYPIVQPGQYFESGLHQLAHNLRTPLHQINGFAELLLMDETLCPAQAEYVRAILSAGDQLNASVLSYLAIVDKDVLGALLLPRAKASKVRPYLSAEIGSWAPSATARARKARPTSVIGPLGERMTLASLPPPETKRWVAQRKAELVAAVDGGLLTVDEVCERYGIALEEWVSWQRGLERQGLRGLWQTRLQRDRALSKRTGRH